jgi:hypothetical protein
MLIDKKLANVFVENYKSLLQCVNEERDPININEYEAVRTSMFANIEKLNSVKREYLSDFIESIKAGIFGKFIYMRKSSSGYILFHVESEKYYQVLGLNSPLEELAESYSVIKTAIIPYASKYVCDGLVADLNVSIGQGMAKVLEKNYLNAIELGEVLKSA